MYTFSGDKGTKLFANIGKKMYFCTVKYTTSARKRL